MSQDCDIPNSRIVVAKRILLVKLQPRIQHYGIPRDAGKIEFDKRPSSGWSGLLASRQHHV